jgi:arabinose-5-phosphate isomerase
MKVKELVKWLPSIDFDSTIEDALNIITGGDFDSIVVVENESPVGILSSYDILEKIVEGSKLQDVRARDLMNRNILFIDTDTEAKTAAQTMLDHKHWMAIVTENGKYKGVVAVGGLLKAFRTDFPIFLRKF